MSARASAALGGVLLLAGCLSGHAQWLTQTNIIQPGWNAVYLFEDASGQSLDTLVAGNPSNPIDQVWQWKVPASPAQYVSNPNAPLTAGSQWLTWVRLGGATANGLQQLSANAAYLVHSGAATNFTWTVQGRPVPPAYNWDLTGLNFIGFPTPAVSPPNFQTYFASARALAALPVYQYPGLDPDAAVPQPVFPYAASVVRGQAYWIGSTNGFNNSYFGPFQIILPNPSGIDFTNTGSQVSIHIENTTTNNLTVSVQMVPSETPVYGAGTLVGPPPVLIRGNTLNTTNLTYDCTALAVSGAPAGYNSPAATNTARWTLTPKGQIGSDAVIVLGVNRYAMTAAPGSEYAGILRFTDSLQLSSVDIPVAATVSTTAGLWVGSASVTQVGNYLKTYATNANGTVRITPTTGVVPPGTNALTYYSTNLVINNYTYTNTAIVHNDLTNISVVAYVTNSQTVSTNGAMVVTNRMVNSVLFSSTIITLDIIPPYYVYDAGGNLEWVTEAITNTQHSSYNTTNWWTSIASVAAPLTNGTPAVATCQWISGYSLTNLLVTNDLFMSPVTNLTVSQYFITNTLPFTNAAYDVCTTNPVATQITIGSTNVTDWIDTNVTVSIYSVTNQTVFTNGSILTVTNGWLATCKNLLINNYDVTNRVIVSYQTNTESSFSSGGGGVGAGGGNMKLNGQRVLPAVLTGTSFSTAALVVTTNLTARITTNLTVDPGSGSYVVAGTNTTLGAVPAPFPLRLIVFSDGTNSCLLQRVYYGLNTATNFILATTQAALDPAQLSSARRISATQLPWTAANTGWPLAGQLGQGGTLTTTVTDPFDDQAANPFLHTYHPDHNNLDATYQQELARGAESYDIVRNITLSMVPPGLDFTSLTTAGSSLSGLYAESINLVGTGGAARTFNVSGNFSFNRLATISTLTSH